MGTSTDAAQQSAVAVIDTIEDEFGRRTTVAPLDGRVWVRDWALDERAAAFDRFELAAGGASAAGTFTQPRPDVAAHFRSPENVGFQIDLDLRAATLGHHPLALTGVRADGARVPIAVNAALDVVAPLHAIPAGLPAGPVIGAVDEVRAEASPRRGGQRVEEEVGIDATLVVLGWAASPRNVPAALAYAEIDGARVYRGMAGHGRADVATALGTEHAGYGFRIRIPARELGAGEHVLRVLAVAEDCVGPLGEPVRFTVDAQPSGALQRGNLTRGRIDVVGRLGEDKNVHEERTPMRLGKRERAVLTGWAGDAESGALPDRLVLAVDGYAHGTVQRGIERDDVVASLACPGLRRSGFSAVIRGAAFGVGYHRAELIAFYAEEPAVLDSLSFEITS